MAGASREHAEHRIMDAKINKWNCIYSHSNQTRYPAVQVLTENDFLLPITGTALDLACGLGGNAIFLAELGLAVTAWIVLLLLLIS